MTVLPYGTWPSPLAAADLAASSLQLSDLCVDGEDLYWIASRPDEGGRYAVSHRDPTGAVRELSPADYSARTRVHEYGGRGAGRRARRGAGLLVDRSAGPSPGWRHHHPRDAPAADTGRDPLGGDAHPAGGDGVRRDP
ncbi:MAG TPA: hypothetical protein VMM13_05205 [Euzebya sp.]|nr:hypothetical protein [Euzebya sp.]